MLQNNQFDLQIIPGSIPPVLHMSQYDSGRQYTATLKNGSANYSVASGATAKIKGFNAAGVAWEQEATISGSTVIFTPSGAATDQFGVMPVTIEITSGEEVITPLLVVFDIQRAGYTNEEAVRSPEFETALEAAVAAAIEEGGIGFSDEFKQALLACFAHVAWTDEHGQDYYDALEAALYPGPAPVTLVSITADYEQDRPIYDTDSLDLVKLDLIVTANYSDGNSVVLDDDDYELSGTLTVGTSTITVSYGGKSTTISVTVTAYWDFEWDYTMGKIEEQTGWLLDKSSSGASSSLTGSAERIVTSSSGSYFQCYINPDGVYAALRNFADGRGVLECTFVGHYSTAADYTNLELRAVNTTTNRVAICINKNMKFVLETNSSPASSLVLADFVNDTEYTARIVCKGTTADLYLNGTLAYSDIDMSSAIYGAHTCLMLQRQGSGFYTDLKAVKIKAGSY